MERGQSRTECASRWQREIGQRVPRGPGTGDRGPEQVDLCRRRDELRVIRRETVVSAIRPSCLIEATMPEENDDDSSVWRCSTTEMPEGRTIS